MNGGDGQRGTRWVASVVPWVPKKEFRGRVTNFLFSVEEGNSEKKNSDFSCSGVLFLTKRTILGGL